MPVKHRIRHSAKPVGQQGGLIQGKRPHRLQNAHKVLLKWPYFRSILLWISCSILLFLSLSVIVYGVYLMQTKIIYLGLAGIAFWLMFKTFFYLSCKGTICPLCRASHLICGKSSKHAKAYKVFPFSYVSTAIFTAALTMCVRCMHCGVTFDLNKKHR